MTEDLLEQYDAKLAEIKAFLEELRLKAEKTGDFNDEIIYVGSYLWLASKSNIEPPGWQIVHRDDSTISYMPI